MTREEAREILSAWRPWAKDAQSAEFAAALALCRQDAELAEWFKEHQAVQEAIRAAFKKIPVPEGLKEQIVSEHKSEKVMRLGQRHVSWYAMAASVALVIGVAVFWHLRPGGGNEDIGLNGYRNRMVRAATRSYVMDMESADAASVRSYLGEHKGHADFTLPKKLEQTQVVGCGVKSWQGRPVTMVCFRTGKPLPANEKSDLFLFVVDRSALTNWPEHDKLVMQKVNTLATATWVEGDRIYLLASPDETVVKETLSVKTL